MKALTKLVNRYCGITVPEEQAGRILASQLCPNQRTLAGSIKIPSTRPCLEGLGQAAFPTIARSPTRSETLIQYGGGFMPSTGPIPTHRQTIPAGPNYWNVLNPDAKDKPGILMGSPPPSPRPGQGLLDTIEDNYLLIGGGLVAMLVLSMLTKGRKGRRRRR